MPVPVQETAAVAVGTEVFVLGGFEELAITDSVRVYDVAGDSWSLAPAMPSPMHHANATVVDGTIFVVGDIQTLSFTPVGDVWSYDPATATDWTVHPLMPRPRGSSVVGVIGGKIYVAGGLANGAVDQVDEYDPVLDTWTPRAALPAPRDHACGGVIDDILYVAGGRMGQPDSPLASVYAFDPTTNVWTEKAPMPTARGGTACGVIDGKLIVAGGEGNAGDPSGVFAETEQYDPVTDTWTVLPVMTHPRHGMGAAVVNGQLFVPGGADVTIFAAVDTHDVYIPTP
jgi:N-acetylneuraminic acid mutarotase